jgi:transcriptional regulator with XRE-family HTH domain
MAKKLLIASTDCLQTMTDEDFFGDKSPGEWLRGIRTELGFTQQEMSDVLGYTRVNYTKFESGYQSFPKSVATVALLMRIMYHSDELEKRIFVSPPRIHDALIQEATADRPNVRL